MRQTTLGFLERSESSTRPPQTGACSATQAGGQAMAMTSSQLSNDSMRPPLLFKKSTAASQQIVCTQAASIAAAVCNLNLGGDEASQVLAVSQVMAVASQDDIRQLRCNSLPKDLTVEVTRYPSQDHMACTPDYATPVEQQFHVDYDLSSLQDQQPRSPANSPGPIRLTKRARHAAGLEEQSEATSQPSQSSQRSAGEPSTSSQPGYHLPPVPSRGKSRFSKPHSPASYKNPFITGVDRDQRYGMESAHPRQCPLVTRLRTEFKDIQEIGSGSFSRVYRATHRIDGMTYAIKRTKHATANDQEKNTWLQEVQAMAAVQTHPNIVKYYSAWAEPDMHGDHLFIQMELCGESLSDVLAADKSAWREPELVGLLKQMASALAHIHSKGMVHLDLKPDNIYRNPDGGYKLGDFGLATLRNGHWRVTEGDARYLAPELLKSTEYSCLDKADIFALGATIYELATGSPLPTGGSVYSKIRQGKLALLPGMSWPFTNLLKSLMHEDPSQRPSADKLTKEPMCSKNTLVFETAPGPQQTSA